MPAVLGAARRVCEYARNELAKFLDFVEDAGLLVVVVAVLVVVVVAALVVVVAALVVVVVVAALVVVVVVGQIGLLSVVL